MGLILKEMKCGMNAYRHRIVLLLLAFIIPFVILLLLFLAVGIAPFGNTTLVLADAKGQYISYFSFYQKLLQGEADPFYSFSKILGGPIAGLYAYYLASPFNLFFLLFPSEKLPLAMDWLIIIKLSLSSLTMAVFFKERDELRIESLVFTTAYALCGYNIAYAWCLIWIDAVICLPLIATGIEKLFRESKPLLYIIFLAGGIISCFYTGYMLCIFSVLFFAYLIVDGRYLFNKKTFWQFVIASLLSGGLSACVLLPGYLALSGGVPKGIYNSISKFTYPAMTLLSKFLFPSLNSADSAIIPLLIGVFIFFCTVIFYTAYLFLTQKGSAKKRTFFLCGCIALLTAWYFLIELPIHKEVGFSDRWILTKFIVGYTPFWEFFDGSPNVYTGSLSFMLALCYFGNRSILQRRRIAGALLFTFLLCSVSFNIINVIWHGFEKNNCFNYRYSFVICFVILMLANESLLKISGIPHIALIGASGLCFLVLFSNLLRPIWFFNKSLFLVAAIFLFCGTIAILFCLGGKRKRLLFLAGVELIAIVLSAGMSFKNQTEGQAASAEHFLNVMLYDQRPIQNIVQNDSDFYRIRKQGIYYNYNDPLLFNYSGVSHYSSSEKISTIKFLSALGQQTLSPYWANGDLGESRALDSLLGVRYYIGDPIDGYENLYDNIQRNPYSLPLAFLASQDVLHSTDLSGNAASNLNTVFSDLSGKNVKVFLAASGSERGKLSVSNENVLCFCIDDPLFDGYILYKNGIVTQQNFGLQGKRLIPLGSFQNNDEIEVQLFDISGNMILAPEKEFFYYEDFTAIESVYKLLTNDLVEDTILKPSHVELKENSQKDGVVVLTIPKDEGWNVFVDEQEVEPVLAFNSLMAIPLSAGEHHIQLKYTPLGLRIGIGISSSSLIMLIIWMILLYYRRKQITKAHF